MEKIVLFKRDSTMLIGLPTEKIVKFICDGMGLFLHVI